MNNGFTDTMYRRPRSLEKILAIRTAMSEEAGYDIPAFVEMVRSGERPSGKARTVTRVEGSLCEEPQHETVADKPKVGISDR